MVQEKARPPQRAQNPSGFLHEQQSVSERAAGAEQASQELVVAQLREQLLCQISEDIRSATSVEEAMERAITALGREMGASEVLVRLGTEAELLSYATKVGVAHAPRS